MFKLTQGARRLPLLGLAAVTASLTVAAPAVSAASAAPAASPVASRTAAHAAGMKTPAIGVHPHFISAGQPESTPEGVIFGCQKSVPAGCYGPDQMRAAYGVDKLAAKGLDGAAKTIVIIDAYSSPSLESDLAKFDQLFGLPAANLEQVAPDGVPAFDGSQIGWQGEITLDVEWAHAIAPGAKIKLVEARSSMDADILSATRYAINGNVGDVISQSFGEAESCMDPALVAQQHALFAQAVKSGITLLASSGDQGSAQPSCDGNTFIQSASTPASDPAVTGVGGTRLVADGISGAYQSESVWNEQPFESAGGGGFSSIYKTPSFQNGNLHLPSRGVPDVSYNAAIIGGVLAVFTPGGGGAAGIYRFGGTSAGSPQWAGLIALADQAGGNRLGSINTALYAISHSGKRYTADFHDVTSGTNAYTYSTATGGQNTVAGYNAATGWDPASGLGTPRADVLVPTLAQMGPHGTAS